MPRMRWTLDQKKHQVAAWRASGLTRENVMNASHTIKH
ncbi:TPA: IS66 family insertion sequence element accessory protein TnpB, partial [Escherichia coli]|nr:IS66 family insertion sequence element accessory protein TnpB [Escherichia coli]